ncbi:MAG: polyprenyl synthetase family protein [Frisingicoccus sp.]
MKEQLIDAAMILSKTVENMCIGEIGQAVCRYDVNVTVDAYLKNIKGKTASLFSTACELGAIEAGCSEDIAGKLKRFGEYLGIMFQFRDDLLDFTSSEVAEGKKTHKDFHDGIYTLPVLMALGVPEAGSTFTDHERECKAESEC